MLGNSSGYELQLRSKFFFPFFLPRSLENSPFLFKFFFSNSSNIKVSNSMPRLPAALQFKPSLDNFDAPLMKLAFWQRFGGTRQPKLQSWPSFAVERTTPVSGACLSYESCWCCCCSYLSAFQHAFSLWFFFVAKLAYRGASCTSPSGSNCINTLMADYASHNYVIQPGIVANICI